jgi:SAM-dependent methyltransferase
MICANDEPPLEPAFSQWRDFYANRQKHYAEILKELGEQNDAYSSWYRAGGYGYDPKSSRLWLINETSVSDFRGTCLDIGSGDGFWTWLLAEWFQVTGIDPVAGGVDLANAIRRRLPRTIQRRTRFIVGDALEVADTYDVIFCRAPSFFNYPIFKPFSPTMLDGDRKRLCEVWAESNPPEVVAKKLAAYPKFTVDPGRAKWDYADKWRDYLKKMLSITGKLFLFILSTKQNYYGVYIGDTYNHDPDEVTRLFAEYGDSRVRMDSTNTYIVAEIYR